MAETTRSEFYVPPAPISVLLELGRDGRARIEKEDSSPIDIKRIAAILVCMSHTIEFQGDPMLPEHLKDLEKLRLCRRWPISDEFASAALQEVYDIFGNDVDLQDKVVKSFYYHLRLCLYLQRHHEDAFASYNQKIFHFSFWDYRQVIAKMSRDAEIKLSTLTQGTTHEYLSNDGDTVAKQFDSWKPLGAGSFGQVALCPSVIQNQLWAVKRMRIKLSANPDENFFIMNNINEIVIGWECQDSIRNAARDVDNRKRLTELEETTAMIKHVKITSNLTFAYCYIPYVENGDLYHAFKVMRESWTLKLIPPRFQSKIALGALVACWKCGWGDGIVHANEICGKTQRDVFPRNVLLGPQKARASDFGLAGVWNKQSESFLSEIHSTNISGLSADVMSFTDCILSMFGDALEKAEIIYFDSIQRDISDGAHITVSAFMNDPKCPLWKASWFQRWMSSSDFEKVKTGPEINWSLLYQWFLAEYSRAKAHKVEVALALLRNGENLFLESRKETLAYKCALSDAHIQIHELKQNEEKLRDRYEREIQSLRSRVNHPTNRGPFFGGK